MLMRQPEYIDQGYSAIKKKIDACYTANQSIWQIYWTEATINVRLEAGDTSLMAELNTMLPNNNRGSWYFNRVRPLCNMVSGHQRRNRKSTIVVPLENADQETADQWTKILMHIYKKEGVNETISEAFHQGACITGLNLLQVYLDFRNDPINGEVKVDNCQYNSFFIDPYFRKPDLSDCQFVWRRTFMSHTEAASLIPEKYDEIMNLQGNPTGLGRDGRFAFLPEATGQTQSNKLAYDEYWYRDYREQKLLVDKQTGDTLEVTDQENVDIDRFLLENPQVELIKQKVPTVRLAILIQDRVFYDGPNPLGTDRLPFVAITGFYNSMMPYYYSRIQGLCTSLRDPQLLYNRRVILNADILESVVNSGYIVKENALVDIKHAFQTGQGRIIPIKEEASMGDIIPIPQPNLPPQYFQMAETFGKEMNFVTGINEENMGMNIDDMAGILSAMRQSAGLTVMQPIFDRLDNACKILGEIVMDVVRNNYTPGKIKKILEGKEPSPFFYKKSFGKYHCAVEQGFDTETQKQLEFAQLLQLKNIGVDVPMNRLINAATLQNKNEMIEEMQQAAQAQQQQQQMQLQSQMQLQAAQAQLAQARTIADQGLGMERISRIEENKALAQERKSEAVKDDMLALLNFAKAQKELESIDYSQLEKLISLQHMMKQFEESKNPPAQEQPAQMQPEQYGTDQAERGNTL